MKKKQRIITLTIKIAISPQHQLIRSEKPGANHVTPRI